jgi:hypothetical protein
LSRCESFADAARERDDPLAVVAVARLAPRVDRGVAAAGGLQHLGKFAPRVSLPREIVALLSATKASAAL